MQRLGSAVLLALVTGCGLFGGSPKPRPVAHTCYRTTGPLLSPAADTSARWMLLTDSTRERAGARWYDGRVVTGARKPQRVTWQRSGPGAIRVRWDNGAGTMEAAEARGILTGTARSAAQTWRVNALREDCPREL